MYCRYCGMQNPDNSNFCSSCGSKSNENTTFEHNNTTSNEQPAILKCNRKTASGLILSLFSVVLCTFVPFVSFICSICGFVISINPKVEKDKLISVICSITTGIISLILCIYLASANAINA